MVRSWLGLATDFPDRRALGKRPSFHVRSSPEVVLGLGLDLFLAFFM